MKPWLQTALLAAGGGALTAGLAAVIDPSHFNFKDGIDEGHVAEMALEGAAVALGGMVLRSPIGIKAMDFIAHSREQAAADREALEQAKKGLVQNHSKNDISGGPPQGQK